MGTGAGQRTVLLVDDERDHLELMERALRFQREFKVFSSPIALGAIEIARGNRVDVVVSDQRMPVMMGVQLVEACQQHHPDAAGVIVTAFPEMPEVVAAVKARGYLVVAKPYDPEALIGAIQQALAAAITGGTSKAALTVLLVDDEPEMLELLGRSLRSERSFTLFPAPDASTALRVLEDAEVHLVVSDFRLPGMNGLALIERCEARYPSAVGVLVTGFADLPEVSAAKASGRFLVLFKPCSAEQIAAVVKQAASFHRIRRALTGRT